MEKIPAPSEKQCEHCKEVKPIDHFYRTKNGRDGYMKKCIVCQKAQNAEAARRSALAHEMEARGTKAY